MSLVCFDLSIVTVKQSFITIVGCIFLFSFLSGKCSIPCLFPANRQSLKILMNEYVVRKVDHEKNVNNKERIHTVPSNA